MVKVASIDLGSNSTRLLIADISDGTISSIHKEHTVTRMGDNLTKTENISKESIKRVVKVLTKYFKTIDINGVENVQIVGTAALRDAENSEEVIMQIQKKFDVEIDIVSGEEEGVLTSLGVLHSLEDIQNFLIVDIGGRSTEFIYDKNNKIISNSLDIGVVSLSELFFSELPPSNESIKRAIDVIDRTLLDLSDFENRLFVGVAGTFTSLASIFLKQDRFNEEEIHLTEISDKDVFEINNSIIQMTEAQIMTNFKGIDPKRAKTIQSGILLANQIIYKYNVDSMGVGCFGPIVLDSNSEDYGLIISDSKVGWKGVNIFHELSSVSDNVRMDTDVNAAALGEYKYGAGQHSRTFVYITIGTGIGVGVLYNGKPYVGNFHLEAGHIFIPNEEDIEGICRVHGNCWEGLASGPALIHRWGANVRDFPPDHEVWVEEARLLAFGIINILSNHSPDKIVLGSSILKIIVMKHFI